MFKIIATYKKAGVYKIVNLLTTQLYIGSTVDIGKRLSCHFKQLLNNIHPNKKLQQSWNKYGELVFISEVLEFCNKEELLVKEQYWIDILKATDRFTGFNICPTPYSQLGRKQSIKEINNRRLKLLNKVHSQQSKINMSKGRLGMKFTKQHCLNISKGKQGQVAVIKPVLQYDIKLNFIAEWPSISAAAKALKISVSGISMCAKFKKTTHCKFIWRLKSDCYEEL